MNYDDTKQQSTDYCCFQVRNACPSANLLSPASRQPIHLSYTFNRPAIHHANARRHALRGYSASTSSIVVKGGVPTLISRFSFANCYKPSLRFPVT